MKMKRQQISFCLQATNYLIRCCSACSGFGPLRARPPRGRRLTLLAYNKHFFGMSYAIRYDTISLTRNLFAATKCISKDRFVSYIASRPTVVFFFYGHKTYTLGAYPRGGFRIRTPPLKFEHLKMFSYDSNVI